MGRLTWRRHGRKEPYSEAGIKRLPCFRCGGPAVHQWSACADGNLWRPLCVPCDVELNEMVLRWMGFTAAEVDERMAAYRSPDRRNPGMAAPKKPGGGSPERSA